ncbi:MAG: phage baseplate assembly protein V, partial [Pseudarthrobacter sp.]
MMSRDHFGIYRGIVASDIHQDDEGRMRVRVRVPYVHTPSVETEALPFAEMCQDVGQMRGKFFPFRSGDLVWVMFDGGEPDKPVIVGGQVNAIKGVSDLPLDVQIDQSGEVVVETDDA